MADLVIASISLLIVAPVILAIALLIRVTSPGPVLFRQVRSGRDGRPFVLLKFRTMRHASVGRGITQRGDIRVTQVGRMLRACKLDELPQLVNVLRGEMSLVGPRPDLPEFWRATDEATRAVLALCPGVTGAASLYFRDEERLLASVPADQLTSFYVAVQLPAKAAIDLQYAARATFLSDLGILIKTLLPFAVHDPCRATLRSYEPISR